MDRQKLWGKKSCVYDPLMVPSCCFAALRRRSPSRWPQHIPVAQNQRAASQTAPQTLRVRAAQATARRTSPWKPGLLRYHALPPSPSRTQCKKAGCWLWGWRQTCTLSHLTDRQQCFPCYTLHCSASAWQWSQAGLTGSSLRLQVLLPKSHCTVFF